MILALVIAAQAAEPNLGLGYTHREQRDLQASPLRYGGHAPTLRLGVDAHPVSGWLDVRGVHWNPAGVGPRSFTIEREDALTGEDESFTVEPPHWGVAVQLGAQAEWPVGPVRMGPRVTTDVHYANMALNTWALHETELDVRAAHTLGPVEVGAWLPLFAVVTRFPYGLDPLVQGRTQFGSFFASGTAVQGWIRRQAMGADAVWRIEGEGWDYGVRGALCWSHSAYPEDLYALEGQVVFTLWRAP